MYSPKIRGDLIPRIHEAARQDNLPMTTWVNRVLERALTERAEQPLQFNEQPAQRKEYDQYEYNRP